MPMKRKKATQRVRKNNFQTILAGGGVIFRYKNSEPEILLIKRNGYWDLPKGKKEDDETIAHCAVREVAEETGISLPCIVSILTDTYHEYELNDRKIGKTTTWFSMIEPEKESLLVPQKEEGITELQWVPASRASDMVEYDNLSRVIGCFLEKLT